MTSQYDLSKLPVRASDADRARIQSTYSAGQLGLLEQGEDILANLAATVRTALAVSGSFTRPADTTAYASGDLVANSTTSGSVVPVSLKVARNVSTSANIRRVRLAKSGTSVTNASFRVHLYSTTPTPVNGDNGAWSTTRSGYLGSFDITVDKAFTDGAAGAGVPNVGTEIPVTADLDGTLFALVEARAAYTPANAETFTITLEATQS